jgi:hypothetical protein
MSYKTVEVELENGHVRASGAEPLPAKAHALLTILTAAPDKSETPGESEGPSLAELARDFCGIGNGTHNDLSYNKAHLDDLGR